MIQFENAGISFSGSSLLSDVSVEIPEGSFVFLTGESGAGKSVFLRMCHADLSPDQGSVRFFGKRLGRRNRGAIARLRRRVSIVHQTNAFLDHLTVLENIALPLRVSGIDLAERAEDLEALLHWVELSDLTGLHPPELSNVERRRAALARAVVLSPDVVLADEPTSGLDATMEERLLNLLCELNRLGKAVVVASRDRHLFERATTQVPIDTYVAEQGRIVSAEPL